MQGIKPFARGLVGLGLGCLVGCASLGPAGPGADPTLSEPPPTLDEESARFAEVLARYARGLLHDFNQEYDAALTNYLQAVELDTSNLELNLRIAMGLLQQKRPNEAVQIMEALVVREPRSAKALAWMALVYRAADRIEDAEATYRDLLALDPGAGAAYLDVAAFYLRDKRREEARAILQTGIRKARDPLNLYRTLAASYLEEAAESKDPDTARALRESAAEPLRKAARIEPDEIQTPLQLGSLYVLNGDLTESLKWYANVEKQAPRDMRLRRRLALSYQNAPSPEEAVAGLERMAEDEAPAQASYYLGELYESQDRIDDAVDAFRRSIQADRKNPGPVLRLALLQIQHDRQQDATDTLAAGLERIPEHPELTTMMAYTFLNREEADLALEWFARAERLRGAELDEAGTAFSEETEHARFYYNYAKAAVLADRTDDAIRHLSRVLDDDVGYLRLFMYDMLREDEPRTEEALRFFHAFADANPDEPAVYYCLGMLQSFDEDYGEALVNYRKALSIAQRHQRNTQLLDADFYFGYAAAHERTGRIVEAEALFRKTLSMDPDHVNTLNYLAYMWAERGERLDEAMEYVERAIKLVPDSGAFLDTRGWIHYQLGNFGDALRDILRAEELVGDDAVIADHLGDVLIKLDRPADAVAAWQRAYRLDPDQAAVAEKLRALGAAPSPAPEAEPTVVPAPDGDDEQALEPAA